MALFRAYGLARNGSSTTSLAGPHSAHFPGGRPSRSAYPPSSSSTVGRSAIFLRTAAGSTG